MFTKHDDPYKTIKAFYQSKCIWKFNQYFYVKFHSMSYFYVYVDYDEKYLKNPVTLLK